MQGKLCLVTGATSGIGLETALALSRMGAHVALCGRDPAKLEAAARTIADHGGINVTTFRADLSSQSQVRQLAADFKARHDHLDVLVNNAGAIYMDRRTTVDGHELTFALNHLAYFTLTLSLLDVLKSSGAARIVNVASAAHYSAKWDPDDLQSVRSYGGLQVYAKSKLANLFFTFELARRLQGTKVTANTLHPGLVSTNFGNANGWWSGLIKFLFFVGGIKQDQGARTSVYLAGSPEVEGVSGKYFDKQKEQRPSAISMDETLAARLWADSERLTGLKLPA